MNAVLTYILILFGMKMETYRCMYSNGNCGNILNIPAEVRMKAEMA